jgi:hypothetical protein
MTNSRLFLAFLFILWNEMPISAQSAPGADRCGEVSRELTVSEAADQECRPYFEQLFSKNGELFLDSGLFEFQMSGWEGRRKWAQDKIKYFRPLLGSLAMRVELIGVFVTYGEVTLILKPDKKGQGRILAHSAGERRCAPYDEILDTGEGVKCGSAWVWRGSDPSPEWMWTALKDGRAIYVARIHLNPKYKVVYIFSDGPLSKEFEDLWNEKQAFEDIDYDMASGQSKKTGIIKPMSGSIRLLEEDFPLLEKGVLTEDFRLGAPK